MIEQIFIIYMLVGMLLMLPAFAISHELFKNDKNSELKIGTVVCIFGGPGVWMTLAFLYLMGVVITYVGKAVEFISDRIGG